MIGSFKKNGTVWLVLLFFVYSVLQASEHANCGSCGTPFKGIGVALISFFSVGVYSYHAAGHNRIAQLVQDHIAWEKAAQEKISYMPKRPTVYPSQQKESVKNLSVLKKCLLFPLRIEQLLSGKERFQNGMKRDFLDMLRARAGFANWIVCQRSFEQMQLLGFVYKEITVGHAAQAWKCNLVSLPYIQQQETDQEIVVDAHFFDEKGQERVHVLPCVYTLINDSTFINGVQLKDQFLGLPSSDYYVHIHMLLKKGAHRYFTKPKSMCGYSYYFETLMPS